MQMANIINIRKIILSYQFKYQMYHFKYKNLKLMKTHPKMNIEMNIEMKDKIIF